MAQLLFFGKLGDLAGGRAREISLPGSKMTVAQLIATIDEEDTTLGSALRDASVRVFVNEKICPTDKVVADSDEIAFLPPVSGG